MRHSKRLLPGILATLALVASDRPAVAANPDESVSTDAETTPPLQRQSSQSTGIRGRILTKDGIPVSGALISVECVLEPCPSILDLGVISNAEGFFFWPLNRGHYRLTVRKSNFVRRDPRVIVVECSEVTEVTLRLNLSRPDNNEHLEK
ncbi:MAG: carboxypeptidase-like regulatory domain-containing protein [Gammaproteobacteria bacterium]